MLIENELWAKAYNKYTHVTPAAYEPEDKMQLLREALRSTNIDHGQITRDFFADFKLAAIFDDNYRHAVLKTRDELWAVYESVITEDGEDWFDYQELDEWKDYNKWLEAYDA